MAEPAGLSDVEARARVTEADELLGRLEQLPGPATQVALEAIGALTEIYGAALARVIEMAAAGSASTQALASDQLVGHLLVLHGLHPDPPEQRITRALAGMRASLGNGGDVELAGIREGIATIRLTVTGCRSTAASLAAAVRDVVYAAAPELAGVEPLVAKPPALIPVEALSRRPVPS
jgi:Fe-S cluster biogenesis protein NfuA